MKRYVCHKIVQAAKISGIRFDEEAQQSYLVLEDTPLDIRVTAEWLAKHKPEVGGYLVEYADGYRSYSPAKAFEEGYTLHPNQE